MISVHQLLYHQNGFPFLETLPGPWLNAYVPQTLPLGDESLGTGKLEEERAGLRFDGEPGHTSLPGVQGRPLWVPGGETLQNLCCLNGVW